jgi:hypothetical protein
MSKPKSAPANDVSGSKPTAPAKIESSALATPAKVAVSSDIAPNDIALRKEAIAEAAYLIAEQRHFQAGHEVEDWLAAENALNLSCGWIAEHPRPSAQ